MAIGAFPIDLFSTPSSPRMVASGGMYEGAIDV